jgi:hypothetical protein
MASSGQRALLVVLGLLSIGCVMASLAALVAMFIKYGLVRVAVALFVFILIGLVVSLLLFIFALYASCHRRLALRVSVIIVFLLFAAGTIGLGVYALFLTSSVLAWLSDLWDKADPTEAELRDIDALENAFDCCGWATYRPECNTSDDVSLCERTISRIYHGFVIPAATLLLVFGGVLLVATFIACRDLCISKPDNDRDRSLSEKLVGSSHATARTTHFNNYTW